MANDNRKIMQYFSSVQELADTINRSYNYADQRIHKKGGKDFSPNEWKIILNHISDYKANRDAANASGKEEALRAIKTHLEELGKIIGELIDDDGEDADEEAQ